MTEQEQVQAAEAMGRIFQDVYAPAFLKRAAEHGLVPGNEQELEMMLDTALRVKLAEASHGEQLNGELHKRANAAARQILGGGSADDAAAAVEQDEAAQRYAEQFGLSDEIKSAMDTLSAVRKEQ